MTASEKSLFVAHKLNLPVFPGSLRGRTFVSSKQTGRGLGGGWMGSDGKSAMYSWSVPRQ